MAEIHDDLDSIRAYRANLLERLEYELIRFRCKATAEEIQKFIYEREEERPVSEYIARLMAIFDPSDTELDHAISVIQDAWNYLPHRVYGGRSPAEIMLGLESEDRRRPKGMRRKSASTEK